MHAYGRSEFADRFALQAADSDYSNPRYSKLQGVSQYDIRAAAEALWAYAIRNDVDLVALDLTEQIVITAMLSQERRWDDENDLVSSEFEDYWDATDEHNFSTGLRKQIQEELARNFLAAKREKYVVVNGSHGIWLFDKNTIWEG